MEIQIEKMTPEDMNFAIFMAEMEGWNPGLNDAECFYSADPDGFFVAKRDGRNIGCISAVKYSENFGFIGFYVVVPEERGSTAGVMLARRAGMHLNGCNIGLDGVINRVDNYAKLGYNFAYKNYRFESIAKCYPLDEHIIRLDSVDFAEILAYDRKCFPAERELFLKNWLTMPNMKALAYEYDGKLLGFGCVRQCKIGWKIGPLFADSPGIANKLFQGLSNFTAGKSLYFDVPEINKEAVKLTKVYGMTEVFSTARMYTESAPALDYNKIYSITSFELG